MKRKHSHPDSNWDLDSRLISLQRELLQENRQELDGDQVIQNELDQMEEDIILEDSSRT